MAHADSVTQDLDPLKDAPVGVHRLQRGLVLTAFDGLTDKQWVTSVLPSGWTPAALVAHLALDVERWWFGFVQDGELDLHALPEDGWHQAHAMTAGQVRALYASCCAEADEVIARTSLDAALRLWPVEMFGDFRLPDLRAVLLHVITETAAHLSRRRRSRADRRTPAAGADVNDTVGWTMMAPLARPEPRTIVRHASW